MRGKAGYSEAKTESIDAQRAQLSHSLAASMKANLLGAGDVEEQLFADKERKADLEATKAALRHQVAAERSRGAVRTEWRERGRARERKRELESKATLGSKGH